MRKLRTLRFIALFFLVNMLYEICFPTVAFALTGGPSQPEVESFEPVSTTQMVDPFTGDFNYNIPLMDVDGYPVNISYHSGVTMDQEASWVGLGWNLNPGVINRNMRGLPDDFSGENDEIEKKMYIKDNWTVGASTGPGWEYFGLTKKENTYTGGISLNIGINYNNYTGVGIESAVSPTISANRYIKTEYLKSVGMNGGLELKSSSKDGLSIQPSVGMNCELSKMFSKTALRLSPNVSASMSINSQKGIEYLAFQHGVNISGGKQTKTYTDKNGKEYHGQKGGGLGSFMNGSSVSYATQTYTPSMDMQMKSSSYSLTGKWGPELVGWHPYWKTSGYYSKQAIDQTTQARPAYGYLNADGANNNDQALMDFNREKDGSYSEISPVLAIPSQTYDLFSASGHGIGGMFRAYRSDIAIVSDPYMASRSVAGTGDVELGLAPPSFKLGVNVQANWSKVSTGAWKKNNMLYNKIGYKGKQVDSDPMFEPAAFKNIGEKNAVEQNLLAYKEINKAVRPKIKSDNGEYSTALNSLVESNGDGTEGTVDLTGVSPTKTEREKKNQLLSYLKVSEKDFCLQESITFGYPDLAPNSALSFITRDDGPRKANHISEVTVTNTQGMRYVYGIAAYNNLQYDFTFTNAMDPDDHDKKTPLSNCTTGQVPYYLSEDNAISYDNPHFEDRDFKGNNHFFSATKTPGYAHSYLLTAVLSPDYVDVNNNGPDKSDLGDYTNIGYYRVSAHYQWRVPVAKGAANYSEGYKSDKTDDMASFMYGDKELWLVRTIEGKNTIAYFYISKREDALAVDGEKGGIEDKTSYSYKLDRIALFSKSDLTNPIKQVFFEYDYSLCPLVENNSGNAVKADGTPASPTDVNVNAYKGKLTLKRLYFTYGSTSQVKGRFNSYIFDYHESTPDQTPDPVHNPDYNLKGYDRWGNYKRNQAANCSDLTNPEFPYADQNKDSADAYASAWSMVGITLPSGGKITIDYESDDYAYVQDKKAMQMYKIAGFSNDLAIAPDSFLAVNGTMKKWIFFELPDDPVLSANFAKDALTGEKDLYYNCLVDLTDKFDYEYVRGYATIVDATTTSIGDKPYGCIQVAPTDGNYHPISQSAWQLARIHLPYLVTPGSNLRLDNSTGDAIIGAIRGIFGFIVDAAVLIQGMNDKLLEQGYGNVVNCSKSWVRINNLTGFKYGGGCRVKQMTQSDNWDMMGQSGSAQASLYGQVYEYTVEETYNDQTKIISSGVASYEPILGNDENPFRKPVTYDKDNKGVPDDHFYTEEPFGESFFPAPQVGYSRVTVKNLAVAGVTKHATGKVVHEFYTARDFPVVAKRTRIDAQNYSPSYIFNLTKFMDERYVTNSQGFQVELNDMHGKPKAVWNFDESKVNSTSLDNPISGVEYNYSVDDKNKLNNSFKVINANNQVSMQTVGVDVDMVMDSREMKSDAHSAALAFNYDNIFLPPFLIPGITIWGEYSAEVTGFRSAVISRVINRYGIQTETIVHEEGSKISTKNEMLDAETGEVLLTSTTNEFNDSIYNATYPAHWVSDYNAMGPAYKNAGMEIKIQSLLGASDGNFRAIINGSQVSTASMADYFVPGDEVTINDGTSTFKRWVYLSDASGKWLLIDQSGQPMALTSDKTYTLKIIRSGRRNMQNTPVAQVVSMINPVTTQMAHSVNSAVINSSAAEFSDKWRTEWNNYSLLDCNDILAKYNKTDLENEFEEVMIPIILNKPGVTRTITPTTSEEDRNQQITLTESDFSGCAQLTGMMAEFKNCAGTVPIICTVSQTIWGNPNISLSTPTFEIQRGITINLSIGNYNFALNAYTISKTVSWSITPPTNKMFCGVRSFSDYGSAETDYSYSSTIPNTILSLSDLTATSYQFPYLRPNVYTTIAWLQPITCNGTEDYTFTNGSNTVCYKYNVGDGSPLTGSSLFEYSSNTLNCPSGGTLYTGGSVDNTLTAYFNAHGNDFSKMTKTLIFYKGPSYSYYDPTGATLVTHVINTGSVTSQINSSSPTLGIPCLNYTQGQVVNPYVTGIRGNWRKSKDWVYYDNRTPQTTVATNIRLDGTYKTFAPFWKWNVDSNAWLNNSSGTSWTMQNQVTKYTPSGRALESADALQRYSAAVYDEGNNLMLSMANNAKFSQIASDNMEWYPIGDVTQRTVAQCPIEHFSFWNSSDFSVSDQAHTGTRSISVGNSSTASTYRDLYQESGTADNGDLGFKMDIQKDNNGQFNPEPGDYILSAWVKVDNDPVRTTYEATDGASVDISFVGSSSTSSFKPSGPIVEGWQRVEGTFTVPVGVTRITIGMKASTEAGSVFTLFDDLRVHPADAVMKGYVYDPKTLRLMAELDENNYATFYEYDKEGKLIRVKRETEKGIATIKESRNGLYKQP